MPVTSRINKKHRSQSWRDAYRIVWWTLASLRDLSRKHTVLKSEFKRPRIAFSSQLYLHWRKIERLNGLLLLRSYYALWNCTIATLLQCKHTCLTKNLYSHKKLFLDCNLWRNLVYKTGSTSQFKVNAIQDSE